MPLRTAAVSARVSPPEPVAGTGRPATGVHRLGQIREKVTDAVGISGVAKESIGFVSKFSADVGAVTDREGRFTSDHRHPR